MKYQEYKKCTKCNEVKKSIYFYNDKYKIDGLSSSCKECHLKLQRKNKEKRKVYIKKWRDKNRDKVNEQERNRYKKIGYKKKFSDNNSMWKGDDVGMIALHNWIRRRKKKPKVCENCKKAKPVDLANISGEYRRDVKDFEWLCRKCHMTKDGRILNLKQYKNELHN